MNYRHGFHAGNHADVFKHIVILALLERLQQKPGGLFVLDTHGGRGSYALDAGQAQRTGEWQDGIGRLRRAPARPAPPEPVSRYLSLLQRCVPPKSYPGSPLLLARTLREQDRLAACELQPEEAEALRRTLHALPRASVHQRDGYEALPALTPPAERRGLVLVDPPYEDQLDEFEPVFDSLRAALQRWPQGVFVLWYPIKQRILLRPPLRRLSQLAAKNMVIFELLVRPDDSPLRLNGSGMLVLNPPWQFDIAMADTLGYLRNVLGDDGASFDIRWLKQEPT